MSRRHRYFWFQRIFLAASACIAMLVHTQRFIAAAAIGALALTAIAITWPRPRVPISAAVRRQVFARDGSRCQWFLCKNKRHLEIDHIIPISRGGRERVANYLTMCRHHNCRKSNRIVVSLLVWVGVKRLVHRSLIRPTPRVVTPPIAVAILAVGLLAGCGNDDKDQEWSSGEDETHCVDNEGRPVNPDWCDEGHREQDDDGNWIETYLLYRLVFGGSFDGHRYHGFHDRPRPGVTYRKSSLPRNFVATRPKATVPPRTPSSASPAPTTAAPKPTASPHPTSAPKATSPPKTSGGSSSASKSSGSSGSSSGRSSSGGSSSARRTR